MLTQSALAFSRPFTITTSRQAVHCITTLSCALSTPSSEPDPDLLDLYHIDAPSRPTAAAAAAIHANRSLPTYLANAPVPVHTARAFHTALTWRARPQARPFLCIDAGCGSARSSIHLATALPDHDVIAVDRSLPRLNRNAAYRLHAGSPPHIPNLLLLRADLVHFWRLCLSHSLTPDRHYILYPNPYPNTRDLKRRWYGHPIFPVIAKLAGRLEIRASWASYLHDWRAAHIALSSERTLTAQGHPLPYPQSVELLSDLDHKSTSSKRSTITNFETKYVRTGNPVYRLVIDYNNQYS